MAAEAAPNLDLFAAVYLAFGAELLDKCREDESATALGPKYISRLHPSVQERFVTRRRCSFSCLTDVTTMLMVANTMCNTSLEGPQLLYVLTVGTIIANSRDRFEFLEPHLDIKRPMRAAEFEALMRPQFGEVCPPKALLQGVRCILDRYPGGGHFKNSGLFIEDIGCNGKCAKAWDRIKKALRDVREGICSTAEAMERVIEALQAEMLITPFASLVLARHIGVRYPELCNFDNARLGAGAKPALGFIFGDAMDGMQELQSATVKDIDEIYDADFQELLAIVADEINRQDHDDIVARLERLGLMPLKGQTMEHMLCEARKVLSKNKGQKYKRKTGRGDFFRLWSAVRKEYEVLAARQKGPARESELSEKYGPIELLRLQRNPAAGTTTEDKLDDSMPEPPPAKSLDKRSLMLQHRWRRYRGSCGTSTEPPRKRRQTVHLERSSPFLSMASGLHSGPIGCRDSAILNCLRVGADSWLSMGWNQLDENVSGHDSVVVSFCCVCT
eukprot:TRINITY_DN65913_c0_g1_i1.p1 TRINITY_DN65913_c0_g1~~TRINITY_DN65913_c0_g1_i1.p1  ORF type:complete len:502 (+),score=72.99 TRINITY_DN65913_c0_g1_i1:67-1572(+)